jgi:hypothetical protein
MHGFTNKQHVIFQKSFVVLLGFAREIVEGLYIISLERRFERDSTVSIKKIVFSVNVGR